MSLSDDLRHLAETLRGVDMPKFAELVEHSANHIDMLDKRAEELEQLVIELEHHEGAESFSEDLSRRLKALWESRK